MATGEHYLHYHVLREFNGLVSPAPASYYHGQFVAVYSEALAC
jgi:hypothetical protein